jgi:hypothetical protein
MPVSTINQSGLANPLELSSPAINSPSLSSPVLTAPTVNGTATFNGALTSSGIITGGTVTATGQIRAAGGQSRMHFYRFAEGDMGGQFVHMKTNAFQTDVQMYAVRFEGHDYAGSKAILCSLGWYQYSPNNGPINIGGGGTNPVSLYKAADGFSVMVIQTAGYFTSFTVSQMTTTQGLADLVITAARSTGSATGAY